jgi:hypothetical protein
MAGWWCQNIHEDVRHPRLHAVPIGLPNTRMSWHPGGVPYLYAHIPGDANLRWHLCSAHMLAEAWLSSRGASGTATPNSFDLTEEARIAASLPAPLRKLMYAAFHIGTKPPVREAAAAAIVNFTAWVTYEVNFKDGSRPERLGGDPGPAYEALRGRILQTSPFAACRNASLLQPPSLGDVVELFPEAQARYKLRSDWLDYMLLLVRHPFALAPEGNGHSTYRFWESLYAGTIPTTMRMRNDMDDMVAHLPALLLDRAWSSLSPQLLVCYLVQAAAVYFQESGPTSRDVDDWDVARLGQQVDGNSGAVNSTAAEQPLDSDQRATAWANYTSHLRACAAVFAAANVTTPGASHFAGGASSDAARFDFSSLSLELWWERLSAAAGAGVNITALSERYDYDDDVIDFW